MSQFKTINRRGKLPRNFSVNNGANKLISDSFDLKASALAILEEVMRASSNRERNDRKYVSSNQRSATRNLSFETSGSR